ncbi:hypothetical protein Ocin01_14205 [Orchesella cincta]|uniref:Uncharacterized protein n=1 Tax=Orchesella cincta TaxID=48709 RepID=A0A1D2MHI6_ORCCI|nr:hypothetical protein Ocin01_14205 [Orchesella cincta]
MDPNFITEWSWKDQKVERKHLARVSSIQRHSSVGLRKSSLGIKKSSAAIRKSSVEGRVSFIGKTLGIPRWNTAKRKSSAYDDNLLSTTKRRSSPLRASLLGDDFGSVTPKDMSKRMSLSSYISLTAESLSEHSPPTSRRGTLTQPGQMRKSILKKHAPHVFTEAPIPNDVNKRPLKSKSFSGFDAEKPEKFRKTMAVKKDIPLSKYAICPMDLHRGAAIDNEVLVDWEGKVLEDVPCKFFRTVVRKELCTNDDLNEVFADKFCLNDWNDYFGRSLLVTCYLYMVLSIVILAVAIGLYQNPTKAQSVIHLDRKRNMKGPIGMMACGVFNILLALTVYITVLQSHCRPIPYIIQLMTVISIMFLAVACWSRQEWSSPSPRDYASLFVATVMNDIDPDFLQDVWPTLDPTSYPAIQQMYFCCGYESPEDWFNLNSLRSPQSPKIHPSCCTNKGSNSNSMCANLMEEWMQNPGDSMKLQKIKDWIVQEPCSTMLHKENEYYAWDLTLYPLAFFVIHTGILVTLNYLLNSYIREVNTWDGEVRMKLYRQNHKNYLKYLARWVKYQVGQALCSCCRYKVAPSKPPCFIVGSPTHFEVWHTASGEIINVVEVPMENEDELISNIMGRSGFVDLNEVTVESSTNRVGEASGGGARKSEDKKDKSMSVSFEHKSSENQ